jgi:hypothetical protein
MPGAALVISAALHGFFGIWVQAQGLTRAPVYREIADSWLGPGIDVDTIAPTADTAAETTSSPTPPAGSENTTPPPPNSAKQAKAPIDAEVTHATEATHHTEPPHHPRVVIGTPSAAPTRPRIAQTVAPSQSAPGVTASAATPSASSSDGTASAPFGAQGLPVGVRHLPKAFTRALSVADRSDPRWLTLPPGPAGEARVEIPVDEDGKLGELAYRDETERDRLLPVVRHLLENARLLLESGHFSLDAAMLRAGVQRLRVRVEVVERPTSSDPDLDPSGLKELEYEAPTALRPGRGSFALNSGRRVIGWVYVE